MCHFIRQDVIPLSLTSATAAGESWPDNSSTSTTQVQDIYLHTAEKKQLDRRRRCELSFSMFTHSAWSESVWRRCELSSSVFTLSVIGVAVTTVHVPALMSLTLVLEPPLAN